MLGHGLEDVHSDHVQEESWRGKLKEGAARTVHEVVNAYLVFVFGLGKKLVQVGSCSWLNGLEHGSEFV